MVKSWVSFVRKQLGFKGYTEHSGRGSYWCYIAPHVTWEDFKRRVEQLLPKWQERGVVESAEITDEKINVMFVEQYAHLNYLDVPDGSDSYRNLLIYKENFESRQRRYFISFTPRDWDELVQQIRANEKSLTAA